MIIPAQTSTGTKIPFMICFTRLTSVADDDSLLEIQVHSIAGKDHEVTLRIGMKFYLFLRRFVPHKGVRRNQNPQGCQHGAQGQSHPSGHSVVLCCGVLSALHLNPMTLKFAGRFLMICCECWLYFTTTLRIMWPQTWWFGDTRTLLYRVKPLIKGSHDS